MAARARFTIGLLISATTFAFAADAPKKTSPTAAEVLAAAKPGDWRPLDPENTLYLDLAAGRVIIELAPVHCPPECVGRDPKQHQAERDE